MKRFNFKDFEGKVLRFDYFETSRLALLEYDGKYLVLIEHLCFNGDKARTIIDYCYTIIDAINHYNSMCREEFSKHLL